MKRVIFASVASDLILRVKGKVYSSNDNAEIVDVCCDRKMDRIRNERNRWTTKVGEMSKKLQEISLMW